MHSYFDALLRYFEFSGRTGRAQYWIYQLVVLALSGMALFADYRLTGRVPAEGDWGLLTAFVVLFHIFPGITITVRRLHDIGKSGWWYLLNFVPLGGIWILVWTCYASELGNNDYGDPSEPADRRANSPSVRRGIRVVGASGVSLADIEARRAALARRPM